MSLGVALKWRPKTDVVRSFAAGRRPSFQDGDLSAYRVESKREVAISLPWLSVDEGRTGATRSDRRRLTETRLEPRRQRIEEGTRLQPD